MIQLLENLKNNSPSGQEQTTLYVSGKRFRYDQGQQLSSIILNDKKVTFSINHGERHYLKLSHAEFQTAAEPPEPPVSAADQPMVETLGLREQISGFPCQQVRIKEKDGSLTELWVSPTALDMKTFLEEFKYFTELGFSSFSQYFGKNPALKGIPIRIIEYEGGKAVRRATVQKISTNKLPESLFEIPAGYAEVKPSDFPAPETGTPRQKK